MHAKASIQIILEVGICN